MKTRSKKTYEIRHGYLTFKGPTKSAAAAYRDAHMARVFADDANFVPEVITASDRVRGVVWMTGHGTYNYMIQRQDPKDRGHLGASRWVNGCIHHVDMASRDVAIAYCRRHLAQDVFEFLHAQSADVNATGINVIDVNDVEGRTAHYYWVQHQVAYRMLTLRHPDVPSYDLIHQSGPGGKYGAELATIQAAVQAGQSATGVL